MSRKLEIQNIYPLSKMQEGMLFHTLMDSESEAFFEQRTLTIEGKLELEIFEESFNQIIERHDIFRTIFIHENVDKPKQVVLKQRHSKVIYEDLSQQSVEQKRDSIEKFKKQDRQKGFDLTKDLLIRIAIFKTETEKYKAILSYHHILMDGWCISIVINEFTQIYQALLNNNTPQLESVYPYSRYIKWLTKQDSEKAAQYWKEYLFEFEQRTTIPLKTEKVTREEYLLDEVEFVIDESLTDKLINLAKTKNVTINTVFQTIWGILLQKYNNHDDIVFGSVVSGRPSEVMGIEKMIGLFINTIPVRVKNNQSTFSEMITKIQGESLLVSKYGYFPLAEIQNNTILKQNLFDHIIIFENYPIEKELANINNLRKLPFKIIDIEIFEQTNYDFNIIIIPDKELIVKISFNSSLYQKELVQKIEGHFRKILTTVLAHPNIPISDIEIVTDKEKQKIIEDFNNTQDHFLEKTINQFFEEQVKQTPENIALICNDQEMTYEKLDIYANRLARELQNKGVTKGTIVGILAERSFEMLISILAILKAGGAYLPLDINYPVDRIKYILNDSHTDLLLHQNHDIEFVGQSIDLTKMDLTSGDASNLERTNQPNDLAYIIYTSGSTGNPKGVMIEHKSVMNILSSLHEAYPFKNTDVYLLKTTYTFDVSVTELFGWIFGNGRLAILEPQEEKNPQAIIDAIEHYQVTHINFAPSMLNVFLDEIDRENLQQLQSLRHVMVAGETLSNELAKKFYLKLHLLDVLLHNLYGPTEATIYASGYDLTNSRDESYIPIGKPVSNTEIYILDKLNHVQPIGIPGELCIAGDGLARGYLNNPELTQEKFIQCSWLEKRIYKTGDMARWHEDGNIEFLGRIDQQIKLRGFRIELGEIEAKVMTHKMIKDVIVICRKTRQGNQYLAAYYVSDYQIDDLTEFLAKKLPEYMIPTYFIHLEKLPLNSNGKVDRYSLPEPTINTKMEYEAPRNAIEEKLAIIYAEILGIEQNLIGIQDDFFRLGGHSLLATQLRSRILKELDIKLTLKKIFEYSTIKGLAEYCAYGKKENYLVIEPVTEKEYYPLSSAQKRLFALYYLEGKNTRYNLPAVVEIKGKFDFKRLEFTVNQLIKRHESLRTSFHLIDGEAAQVIHQEVNFKINYQKIKDDQVEKTIKDYIKPFDMSIAPLLSVGVIESALRTLLVFDMHHIISDGVSINVLLTEFVKIYSGFELNKLRLQYKDFAIWQNEYMQSGTLANQEEYWVNLFSDFQDTIPVLNLPTDYPRPERFSHEGGQIRFILQNNYLQRLKEISSENNATLYMILLAVYNLLLYKYTDQKDIIVGSPIAGRNHPDLENIIGMFVNTVTMRNQIDCTKSFTEFLCGVKENALKAYENQDYQFENLLNKLKLERDLSRNPLFDTMFVLQNIKSEELHLSSLKLIPYECNNNVAKFDLLLEIVEKGDELECKFEYAKCLFKEKTVQRMSRHFLNIIEEVTRNQIIKIADIHMISTEEKQVLINLFNQTEVDYPKEKLIHQLFEEQVERQDSIAVICEEQNLSYSTLNIKANQLARLLRAKGVISDTIVGIMTSRSPQMIIGIMAIVKAGGAYLPISPDYPLERIEYLVKDSGIDIILTQTKYKDTVDAVEISVNTVLDLNDENVFQGDGNNLDKITSSNNLAYVIYTSGSTGNPKGVLIEHQSVINRLNWMQKRYPLDQKDVILQKTPFTFDVSVWELFWWSWYGAKLCLLTDGGEKDPKIIVNTIEKNKVSVMHFVPSMLQVFLDYVESGVDLQALQTLKQIFASGEALKPAHVERFNKSLNRVNGTRLTNLYGPTEATVDVSYYDCPEDERIDFIAIGKPIDNTALYILDKSNNLKPVGVIGELCIAGDGLARGYLNRPQLNADKFVTNPFYNETHSSDRLYRTGDLAKWLDDGNILYLGRMDNQVKIRGFRIELGEIEKQLLLHNLVKEAVVLAREDNQGSRYLIAYLVMLGELSVLNLREFLAKKLPEYMIPAYFISLDEIPLTSNGKVNYQLLRQMEGKVATGVEFKEAETETERRLVAILKEVLNIDTIGVMDNFFALGGDSIKAIRYANLINTNLQKTIEIADLYRYQQIKQLGSFIDQMQQKYDLAWNVKNKVAIAKIESLKEEILIDQEQVKNLPDNWEDFYPMSDIEQGMFYYSLSHPDEAIYHEQFIYQIKDQEFDQIIFKRALSLLVEKHLILRTSFNLQDFSEPIQIVHTNVEHDCEVIDLSLLKKEEQEGYITDYLTKDRQNPFDLLKAPLWRVRIFRAKENICFVWIFHHAILDGWSNASFITELVNTYFKLKLDVTYSLRKLKSSYKEFIIEQMAMKDSPESITYWQKELEGYKRFTLLKRKDYQSNRVRHYLQSFDQEFLLKLQETSRKTNTLLKNIFFAAYMYMLNMVSYESDLVVGVITNNRPICENGDEILGCFLNSVPVRLNLDKLQSWANLIQLVDEKMVNLKYHERIPLFKILEIIGEKSVNENPVFDVIFNYIDFHVFDSVDRKVLSNDLEVSGYENTNTLFDFTIDVSTNGFRIYSIYQEALFTEDEMFRLYEYFISILKCFINDLEGHIGKDKIYSVEEKQRLLYEFNQTELDYPKDKTIHQLFEEQVEKTPEKIAVVYEGEMLSYRELNNRANQLARLLRRTGAGPEKVVGIMIERSLEMIIGILGIMKAGAAYLPINLEYPEKRILSMLEDANVSILLSKEKEIHDISFTNLLNLHQINQRIEVTPKREQIKDFDSLPMIDRSLIDYEKYHQFIGLGMAKNSISIQATRGCPYNCAFCHKIWPKKHVVRSTENIFNEVKFYYDLGIRRFVFIDDVFNLDIKNSCRFFELIIEHDMRLQLYFPNGLRGDILTQEYIDLMIKAGTVNLSLALETASPRLQKMVGKNMNLEKLRVNINYITENYPHVILELETMVGFPTETEEEALQTLEFIKSLRWVHFPYVHILKIYPNTDMAKLAIENGVSVEAIEESQDLAYHELPNTLPFAKSFVLKYQARFLEEYFFSKERLLAVLPQQMKVLTEDELCQKYDSYLPVSIKSFDDLLQYFEISTEELAEERFIDESYGVVSNFNEKLRVHFPTQKVTKDSFKVLFLDLSQSFSSKVQSVYDVVEQPLGLMYLLTYLNHKFGEKIYGKIAKARIDFDNYQALITLIDSFEPDLIGIRNLTYYKEFFHQTVSYLRQNGVDVPIIAGGPYATSDYNTLLGDRNIDLVVLGEGELTITELITKMMENENQLPDWSVLKEIDGLAFAQDKSNDIREIILIDQLEAQLKNELCDNLLNQNEPDNLLYLIHTSGSTGKPKSVMLEHRNLVNLLNYEFVKTDIDFTQKVLQFTTLSFDVSFQEIFSTLLCGGELYLVSEERRRDVGRLVEFIDQKQINILFMPASFIHFIFSEESYVEKLSGVNDIITAGEQIIITERLRRYLEDKKVSLHNHYGPSESHVVTMLTLTPEDDKAELPSIGRPIANTQIYILSEHDELQPIGVVGELCIAGDGVGRGYLNRPELTIEKFVTNPCRTDTKMYRTGDLARWLADGTIEYMGRKDTQVKIRGFRVETGEIEQILLGLHNISEAVCIVKEDETLDKYLSLYIVAKDSNSKVEIAEIRNYLAKKVPAYMIPTYIEILAQLPKTVTGKIDRKLLSEMGNKVNSWVEEYIEPVSASEKRLEKIWSEVLGHEKIGINANFFDLGGHSLKATIVVSKIRKKCLVDIPLRALFKYPTIKELAEYIDSKEYSKFSQRDENVVLLREGTDKNKHFFLVHAGSGEVEGYLELCNHLNPAYNYWGIKVDRFENYAPNNLSIEDMAEKYLYRMKTIQETGPYNLIGWCIGGTIVYEMVSRLEKLGEKVGFVALINSIAPQRDFWGDIDRFDLNSEIKWIKEYLPDTIQLDNNSSLAELWSYVVDYLKEERFDLRILKEAIPETLIQVIPNYEHVDAKELLYYVNVIRSLNNARALYLPKAKISSQVHFYEASKSQIQNIEYWRLYCTNIEFMKVTGDHFSIFRLPEVVELAKQLSYSYATV